MMSSVTRREFCSALIALGSPVGTLLPASNLDDILRSGIARRKIMRVDDADRQWRETDIYALALATGAIRPLTQRTGPDANPAMSPDGKLMAYTGYDWTKDTYIDSTHAMTRTGS